LRGVRFRWNEDRVKLNSEKHGVSFEQAAQVFFDPFLSCFDASRDGEQRDGAVGSDCHFGKAPRDNGGESA